MSGATDYKYILNEKGEPVHEPDLFKWSEWFEKAGRLRIVKQEYIGDYEVSTIFLGLDYSFLPRRQPLLFETMIFKKGTREDDLGDDIGFQERCGTRKEALAQHRKAILYLKKQDLVKLDDKPISRI